MAKIYLRQGVAVKEEKMKLDLNYFKPHIWLVSLLLLILAAFSTHASAAPTASFSAVASGPVNNLTLTGNVKIADADLGKNGNYYLGVNFQQMWFFNDGVGWAQFVSSPAPIYANATLADRSIEVVRNLDLTSLIGAEVYAGYGLSEADMLANAKFAKVYTVIANTTPTVNATVIVNGGVGVPTNAVVGATFSQPMDPASITTMTVTLMQGTVPVLGSVGYSGNSVVFSPSSPLASNTSYTATIKGGSNGAKNMVGMSLANDFSWSWTTAATTAITLGPAPVLLGTAGNFLILAKTGISSVPASILTGDIGVSPAAASFVTGFSLTADATNVFSTSTQVVGGGKVFAANMAVPTPSNLTTAILNMQTAYTDAAGRPTPDFLNLNSGNIGGLTLVPGLYKFGSAVTLPSDVVISGAANDVWIFQMSGDLIMGNAKRITLSGGAQAKNIFWQVAGQVTIGTTAHFEGIILSQTGITLQTGATMNGRALAQTLVALDSATVTQPAP